MVNIAPKVVNIVVDNYLLRFYFCVDSKLFEYQ